MSLNFELYDYVHEGIFIIDQEYNVIYWNKSIELSSGILRKELLNQNLFEKFSHLNKRFYKARIDEILNGGAPAIFSSQIHHHIIPCIMADGSFRTQNTYVVGIEQENNRFAIFSIHDISDEIRQMHKYKEMRDTALKEVENRKKIEAQLRELNLSKDKFFSIIGHDLKNPINALMGYNEMLLEDYTDLEDYERIEIIESNFRISKGILALLENLLEWARVQTGRIQYNPEKFSLCELTDKLIAILELPAKQKELSLIMECDKNLAVFADKNMIETVLRNLVSNAIKFTPRGGTVEVTAKESGKKISIFVKDTGVGIDKDTVNKIFSLEKNITTQGTENEKGTGLGLLLVKELVEKNHGTISVESEIKKGSIFTVTLNKFII